LASGLWRGSGEKVISVPAPASPVISQYSSVTSASPEIRIGVHAGLLHLPLNQAGFRVVAADINDVDVSCWSLVTSAV
jgi:hypothetical protein